MSEDRVRRIVREEIAMMLVKIVRKADTEDMTPGLIAIRNVINSVANDMVRDLARTSEAGPQ